MSTKPKTRFLAIVNGDPLDLFSVREVTSGDLLITPNRYLSEILYDHTKSPYRESHYSVHKTNGGKDTTVTHKTVFADGTLSELVMFVAGTEHRLLYPIFQRLEAGPPRQEPCQPRDKDRTYIIGEYCNIITTMFYSVFVCLAEHTDILIESEDFNFWSVPFSYFNLLVMVSYVDLTSPSGPHLRTYAGSHPRINKELVQSDNQVAALSIGGAEMVSMHRSFCEDQRDRVAEYLKSHESLAGFYTLCTTKLGGGPIIKKSCGTMV